VVKNNVKESPAIGEATVIDLGEGPTAPPEIFEYPTQSQLPLPSDTNSATSLAAVTMLAPVGKIKLVAL
jgi:hypothetical protein